MQEKRCAKTNRYNSPRSLRAERAGEAACVSEWMGVGGRSLSKCMIYLQ